MSSDINKMVVKSLDQVSLQDLLLTFQDAFADYAVDMHMSIAAFEDMLQIRGYQAQHSVGCFLDDQLQGVILVATRRSDDKLLAYNLTTAVARSKQNLGGGDLLLSASTEYLKSIGVKEFKLEVLDDNVRAIGLYKKHGFKPIRRLCCFVANKDPSNTPENDVLAIDQAQAEQLSVKSDYQFFKPSWQNELASYQNKPSSYKAIACVDKEQIISWGIIHRSNGQILQLGALSAYRSMRHINNLIIGLSQQTTSERLTCLNIAANCQLPDLLLNSGFEPSVEQFEMIKLLS